MAGEFLNPCGGVQMSCCLVPPTGSSHSKAKMGSDAGERHMQKKAQTCKEEERYLGFILKKDTRFQILVGSCILMALA